MVDVQELRKWRYTEPFRQFELILNDRRRFLIEHPWNIGCSEQDRRVAFASGGDNVDIVNFSLVTVLKPPRKRRNSKMKSAGKRGRR